MSVLVVVLALGAIVGSTGGLWLGYHGPGARQVGDVPTTSPSIAPPEATATRTPLPGSDQTASPVLTEPPPTPVLLTLDGAANEVSELFDAVPGWQIQWQTDGERFSFAVTGDQDLGTIVDQPGPASGLISIAPGGAFRISVKAKGSWRIVVSQGRG
jgi:hypothetical protein